ncbi:MAG: GNAT family N-acetyltransferase [bacterium]|nr:GNAT family N-acetyltransferase [bacterium]
MLIRILDETNANYCDALLTKLIQDEKNYNVFINENFIVKDYFKNIVKDEQNILLGYKENKEIVGYVYFKFVKDEDAFGYLIDGLYVEEEYRNKGIAKSLITEGLSIIKEKDISFIDINVMSKNETALNLYKSLGFEVLSFKMRKTNI